MLDLARIYDAHIAAELPIVGVSSPDGVEVDVQWAFPPSPEEQAESDAIIADPLYSARQKRTIHAIYVDVLALTGPQKNAIWNDLSAGTPPKYLTSQGTNDASLAVMYWIVTYSGVPSASIQPAQALVISLYVQDNPGYLRHPPFAPAIDISGDEPIP